MNLRTDGFRHAGWKRAAAVLGRDDVAQAILDDPIPAAALGDVWVIRAVTPPEGETEGAFPWTSAHESEGPILGYAMTCPNEACRFGVHDWVWASNCSSRRANGTCEHSDARRSCWNWTGSVEAGDLSAQPSLFSPADSGGCGFHGFLTNGVLA